METALKEKLWTYISIHAPELMYQLQEEYRVTSYLDQKIATVLPEAMYLHSQGMDLISVYEICMERLTEDLKPSKFLYVKRILEDEFPIAYDALQQSYMLNYEVLNILECCADLFDRFGFGGLQENKKVLKYSIMGEIHQYLS